MPDFTATAPGKIILFGEHAVVYGQPAMAVPVTEVRARAIVRPEIGQKHGGIHLLAPQINLDAEVRDLQENHPLAVAARGVLDTLEATQAPACTVHLVSTIPIASGLGSSAAVSVALIRALAGFLGHPLPDESVSALAYEVEKVHHGTPSGIDNTVVTYAKPVFFSRDKELRVIPIKKAITLVIGDTGISSPTAETVGAVREAYQNQPGHYRDLFRAIGNLSERARGALEEGDIQTLGPLMDENHTHLQEMGVSSPELDVLVNRARDAGALGAKLSGGGRGGNMIALVQEKDAARVSQSLREAGAVHTLTTTIQATKNGE